MLYIFQTNREFSSAILCPRLLSWEKQLCLTLRFYNNDKTARNRPNLSSRHPHYTALLQNIIQLTYRSIVYRLISTHTFVCILYLRQVHNSGVFDRN